MRKTGKVALHWLLIITMMIQPALFSHAMAGMEHSDAAVVQMQDYEMDYANHADGSDHHSDHANAKVDNCCHAPACGPALFVDSVVTFQPLRPLYPRAVERSFYDVDLPVSIKPPRTLS